MLKVNLPAGVAYLLQRSWPSLRTFLGALLVLAIVHALCILVMGINQPPVDIHTFRRTQTALSAYWLKQSAPFFAYETPVLGAPWSIPFEFPFFQYIVALISRLGIPLDAAGRLISFCFYLFTLWPLRLIFRQLRLGDSAFLLTAILFLTCPLYLYWGRTFDLTDFLYQRDREIIAFARPDLAVAGTGVSSAAPVVDIRAMSAV